MATIATAISGRAAKPAIPTVPGVPVFGNLLQFRRDRMALHELAARTNPVLARIQLAHIPIYLTTDADIAHEVLAGGAEYYSKSAGLHFLEPLLGNGLLIAEGTVHKRHRKLLAPAFAPKRLAAYGDVMVSETVDQVSRWTKDQPVDLSTEMMELTLAIAGRTMFSAHVRDDAKTIAEGLELAMRSQSASLKSLVRLGYEWPLPRHRQMRRAVEMLDSVVYRLIAEGRKRGTDVGDVLSILLMARDDDGTGLTDPQVRDEVMTLLLAGHETTANALSWTWYELGRNPGALERLRAEIDTVLGQRTVTVDDLPQLPWTAAVIDEAMRLHPPAYMTGRESVVPVELGGHSLAKGSIVAINIFGIHRRDDYYPTPLAFKPERFLPEAKKARPRHHYLPFGAGPRICIGSHFALMEAQLSLSTLVQRADIRMQVTSVGHEPLVTLRPAGGLRAIVSPRC